MATRAYLIWFLSVVALAVAAFVLFNAVADRMILTARNGPSIQTVSGFERVIKPAWLDSIAPDMVFVGSSRMREGFDPVLIDPAFHVRSFDYGVSSITAYEARRFLEDTLAHPSVKTILLAMDAFSGTLEDQKFGSGFDELRLAVTPDGQPTPRRALWLFTTRYLSGGALGQHALGLYMLAGIPKGGTAADRPDLFEAYHRMTPAEMRADLQHRFHRTMTMGRWQRAQFDRALADQCHRGDVRLILFFPPDNIAIIRRYLANDAAGLAAFKRTAAEDVRRHNATCEGKAVLFDFMNRNAVTAQPMVDGSNPDYIDLVHFRPPVGVRLLRRMLLPQAHKTRVALGTLLAGGN